MHQKTFPQKNKKKTQGKQNQNKKKKQFAAIFLIHKKKNSCFQSKWKSKFSRFWWRSHLKWNYGNLQLHQHLQASYLDFHLKICYTNTHTHTIWLCNLLLLHDHHYHQGNLMLLLFSFNNFQQHPDHHHHHNAGREDWSRKNKQKLERCIFVQENKKMFVICKSNSGLLKIVFG